MADYCRGCGTPRPPDPQPERFDPEAELHELRREMRMRGRDLDVADIMPVVRRAYQYGYRRGYEETTRLERNVAAWSAELAAMRRAELDRDDEGQPDGA